MTKAVRLLVSSIIILFCGALMYFLPKWATAADWIFRFLYRDTYTTLFVAAIVVSLLRRWIVRQPARFVTVFLINVLSYTVIFRSRWWPQGGQPTLLLVVIFLHVSALFSILALDPLIAGFERLKKTPAYTITKSPWFALLFWPLLAWAYAALLQKHLPMMWYAWLVQKLYALLILLPLFSSFIRQRYFGRRMAYPLGLAIMAIFTAVGLMGYPYHVRVWWVYGLVLYAAFWAHLYWEEFAAKLGPEWDRFHQSRLGVWWNEVMAPVAQRPEPAAGAAVDLTSIGHVSDSIRSWATRMKEKGPWIQQGFARSKRYLQWAAYGIAGIALGIWIGPKIYQRFYVTVTEFTPTEQVSNRTVIRISFSESVAPSTGDISRVDCFKITPAISGSYRQENPKTIVFVPREPLAPSTRYHVVFDPKNLSSSHKRIQFRATTNFHTELFAVGDTKLFYAYDLVTNEERQLMGEMNFNYPISLDELRKSVRVFQGKNKSIAVEFEKSHVPTRYYFKTGGIQRGAEQQVITLQVAEGARCVGGAVGLEREFTKTLVLPSKVKLEVTELKLWHEPGNTLVTILFNMPVSESQLRSHVIMKPAIPIQIETEYCYAVLRGTFKPNAGYEVKITKGLVSKSGETLENDFVGSVYIKDLPPHLEFAHKGNILSLSGPKVLQIKTINLDDVNVNIQKIFRNNLIQFLDTPSSQPMAKSVYSGRYKVEGGSINEELTQAINLSKFHNAPYKGLFSITLTHPNNYSVRDQAWFLCTDLGMIAKHSGKDLIVNVWSVATLAPVAGATVELYSDTNQAYDRQVTDASGRATFVNWRNNEYDFIPHFIVAKKEDDFSFLNFDGTALNSYQFGVGGDDYALEGMEAYLATERGVYRPGEPAYVTAVVRNADRSLPPSVPVRLVVRDPRGAEFLRLEETLGTTGLLSFKVPFGLDALTGQYVIQLLRLDKEASIGSVTLKVEEFIPDKLKVEVLTPKEPVSAGQMLSFSVKSRQMFGPPASGNKVVTSIRYIATNFSASDFKGYTFSNDLKSFEEETQELGEDELDKDGVKTYSLEVPRNNPPSALRAYVYSEVFDSGGRPVSAAGTVDIHPYSYYLGLKLGNANVVHAREKVDVRFAAVDPKGHPLAIDNVRLVVKRKAWYSIFRKASWGRSGYQSSSYEELIDNKEIAIKKPGTWSFTPGEPGEYTVILAGENGMRSSVSFNVVGMGYETTNLESPEKLQIHLDKDAYEPGEVAKVTIDAPFTGKLLLTTELEKVRETRTIDLDNRHTVVSVPVLKEHIPNVYVVGMLVRTPDESRATLPMVSYGVVNLPVKTTSKRLNLQWTMKEETQASDGIDVTLHVGADRPEVVLSAVDQGILQITHFSTPDPLDFFYRKRGLTTTTYSIFDLILPDVSAKKFAIGGDAGEFSRRHLNPVAAKKKKSLALYSGILKPDENGVVRYHFDTKGFNGEVRVMALAARGDRFGSIDQDVQVADPIVLLPNYPRAAGPGDQLQIPIEVYNKTGKPGTFTLKLSATGPLKITGQSTQKFELDKDDQKKVLFFAEALQDAGVAKLTATAQGNQHKSITEDELSIRPATALESRVIEGELAPGQSKQIKVPAGFIPFGQKVRLTVSNNPIVRYLRSLDYLISYPYGCAEQTTSQLFPLLYFKSLGYATGRFGDKANAVDEYIQSGIKRLEKMQLDSGEFALWPGGQPAGPWLDHYVSHCLIEAKNAGYSVNPLALARIYAVIRRGSVVPQNEGRLDRSTHNLNQTMDAYLLYLKALINEPDAESMTVLRTQQLANLSETDRAYLSMAYSKLGDKAAALEVLAPTFKSRFIYREQYGSFNSPIRNTAMYLSALVQADPTSRRVSEIVEYLGQNVKDGHFGSTQENVWAFMALAQVYKTLGTESKTDILVGDALYKSLSGAENVVADNTLSGKTLTLKNTGEEKSYYYLIAEGTPLEKHKNPKSNGIQITRNYYDKNGNSVNLSNVVQGEMVVVTLSVRPEKEASNLVVVDVLPAGFEVENPRLSSQGELGFNPPMSFMPAYQDIRDDRVLLFSGPNTPEAQFSYSVRAVTPGRFAIPNAYVEAMYDPDINGESDEPASLVIVDNNAQP